MESALLCSGPVTHRDPQTGAWIPNTPVLSTTKQGWRLDGGWNEVVIPPNGKDRNTVTQTFTDYFSKHKSEIELTLPPLTYERALTFGYEKDGLTWKLMFNPRW